VTSNNKIRDRVKTVDVILLTYNAEQFISKTLESILANRYGAFKIIIADDNSKDKTIEIIKGYQLKHEGLIDLHLNQFNIGVTANTNKALLQSTAEIIMFCGHDDLFYPDKIQQCVSVFEENPRVTLVYHDCDVVVNDKHTIRFSDTHNPQEGGASKYLLYGCFSTGSSVSVRGDLAREIKFNEQIRNTSDFLFFYEVSKRGEIKYIPQVLGAYVRHKSNLTSVLSGREDFDSIKASLHILEHYKEDRVATIINLNWTLLKIFSRNKKHFIFYLISPLVSVLWIMWIKFGKNKIR
jgi:glycosyltransferase involved in cell wall biosynthesis